MRSLYYFMNIVSEAVWKGSLPNRFQGGRIHFRPQDQLSKPGAIEPPVGKRHFDVKQSTIKPFPNTYQQTTTQIRLSQKKNFDFKPSQKHPRRERLHVREGVSGHLEDLPTGILCQGKITKNSDKEHFVEQQMNRKKKLEYYDLTRNQIDVAALGDKPYKYPQQAPGFFHQEGIIVGSTIRPRKPKGFISTISTSTASGRLTYAQKVRLQQQELQDKQIVQLDNWIQHTLKQANPNYKDPDLFLEQQQNAKKEVAKKGTKK